VVKIRSASPTEVATGTLMALPNGWLAPSRNVRHFVSERVFPTLSPLVCSRKPYLTTRRNSDMYDLTGFQRDLLYTIAGQDDPHGLAIKDELEDYEKEIHHGRLYPNLDEVVDKGLVEKGELDQRTNYYTITARGRRELEARREWEDQYVGELLSESGRESISVTVARSSIRTNPTAKSVGFAADSRSGRLVVDRKSHRSRSYSCNWCRILPVEATQTASTFPPQKPD